MISGFGSGVAVWWTYSYTPAMCEDKDLPLCEHDDLIAEVDRQQNENARLRRQVDRQMETIEKLRKQLAAAQRAGKRQAAPFSKGERASKPRRPGRKPGTGSFQLPQAAV